MKRFQTHELVPDALDDPKKDGAGTSSGERIDCRAKQWAAEQFGALNQSAVSVGNGMTLKFSGTGANKSPDKAGAPGERIEGFPLWMVKVDADLMKDHNDIWNSRTTETILQLYWASVLQADIVAAGFKGEEVQKLKAQQEACRKNPAP